MAEWGNLYVIGAIATTLFLGGWQIPWALEEHPVLRNALQFVVFFLKSYAFVLLAIWLRWTLPRIRVDQMMEMCWKYLVPIAMVNFLGTATWMVVFPAGVPAMRWALFAVAVIAVAAFVRRVTFHIRNAGLERRQLLNGLFDSGDGYVLPRGGLLCGYAISRLFGRGHVIGPVVAESPTDARALIEFAIARLGPVFVRIDTPASSQLGEWLESIGLQQVSDATTMVLGTPAPWTGPARMFGLAGRKGAVAVGADADLVVYDPARVHTISARTHHMDVDEVHDAAKTRRFFDTCMGRKHRGELLDQQQRTKRVDRHVEREVFHGDGRSKS